MPRPRLCIISPSLKLGGIERALTVLAEQFTNKGIHVYFISCLKGKRFYQLPDDVEIHEPSFLRTTSFVNKFIYYPQLLIYIRKKVRDLNPDKVLVFGDWFSPLVLLALYGTKYPVYISDRTSPDYKFKFPIPQLKRLLYPYSKGFIAQTKRAADYKRMKFGNRLNVRIIPNAIRDIQVGFNVQREPIILYLGRFEWEKAPDRLIRAFDAFEARGDWQLVMAGDGPLLNRMKILARELNIIDYVQFPGHVRDVDTLLARASIFVLPSVLEGFPNSLCEAMAAGLPSICYDTIPHEEILEDNISGLVVNTLNEHGLSEALQRLMNDKNLRNRLGEAGTLRMKRLSASKIADQYLDFLLDG